MDLKPLCLVFLLMSLFSGTLAQNPDMRVAHEIDSLKKALKMTRNDSDRLNLLCTIGIKEQVMRPGYWDSLRAQAVKLKQPMAECRVLYNMAMNAFPENKSKATDYFTMAAAIAEERNYKPELMYTYGGLAHCYAIQNSIKKALEFYYKQLKIAEERNDSGIIDEVYMGISRLYFFMGEHKKSLEIALVRLKKTKDTSGIIGFAAMVGSNYAALKDEKNAIKYYKESAKYADNLADPKTAMAIYSSAGAAYQMQSQLDSAYAFYQKAYEIARSENSETGIVSTLSLLSAANFLRGDLKTAKRQALEGLKRAKTIGFMEQISRLSLLLKKIHQKNNNYKEALQAFELHLEAKDSIANEKNRKLALQKEFDYAFEKKESENRLLAQQNQIQALKLRQSNYFLFGMGAVLILVFMVAYLFVRQNKIKAEQANSLLEQKLLRSQMNPHFIFNSLQAIQNYILKHDEKQAVKYLSSFAAVTRNVLENSRMDAIPLKKEISLLENYLQLQKLRFKSRFEYEIVVDEAIDTENTAIPPMLAQPFIENAVEHGFHDIHDGRITVLYALKEKELVMEIIDNGIGMKDGYSQSKQHRSLALEITRERVDLMNKKAKEKVLFDIGEAFPMLNERKGVKIRFFLPLRVQS